MKKIVVVEDNPDNRLLVRVILEPLYDVAEYEDGATALEGLPQQKPDLVLLDVSLPEMDGTEVLRRIRADARLQNLPVIALTAHAMTGDREKFLAAGFDDYVTKPILDENLLLEAIQARLAGGKASANAPMNQSSPLDLSAVERLRRLGGDDFAGKMIHSTHRTWLRTGMSALRPGAVPMRPLNLLVSLSAMGYHILKMLLRHDPRPGTVCRGIIAWLVAGFFLVTLAAQAVTQLGEGVFLVQSWQREDGLPDSTISAMAQTVGGFLWLGTPKGLVRFDGERFKIFPLPRGAPDAKQGVTALFKERGGRLWAGTASGEVFKIEGEAPAKAQLAGSVGARVTNFAADEMGTLWVLSKEGGSPDGRIHCLTRSGETLRPYVASEFRLMGFAMDTLGVVWGWSSGELYMLRAGQWQAVASPGGHRFEMAGPGPDGRLYGVRGQQRVGWSVYQFQSGTNATSWGNGPALG
ncbi:MAG: response regulator, partial [Verrucomicrobiota bacterium]